MVDAERTVSEAAGAAVCCERTPPRRRDDREARCVRAADPGARVYVGGASWKGASRAPGAGRCAGREACGDRRDAGGRSAARRCTVACSAPKAGRACSTPREACGAGRAANRASAGAPRRFPSSSPRAAGHARTAAGATRSRLGGWDRDAPRDRLHHDTRRGSRLGERRAAGRPRRSRLHGGLRRRRLCVQTLRLDLGRARRGGRRDRGRVRELSPPPGRSTTSSGSRKRSPAPPSSRPSEWSPQSGGTRR